MRLSRLLGRLRIGAKLALLLSVPLLVLLGLTILVVTDQAGVADQAGTTAQRVRVAGQVGSLVQALQQERLKSIGYMLHAESKSAVLLQSAAVDDQVNDLRANLGSALPSAVKAAVDGLSELAGIRYDVAAGAASKDQVIGDYSDAINQLIESVGLLESVEANTSVGRQVIALDALLHADEANNVGSALLLMAANSGTALDAARYAQSAATLASEVTRFNQYATAAQRHLYSLVAAGFRARVGDQFYAVLVVDPPRALAAVSAIPMYAPLTSFNALGGFVEKKIVSDVVAATTSQVNVATVTGYTVGGLALVIVFAVVALSIMVALAIAVPLTRLTASADRVARAAEAELTRVADDEADYAEPIHLEQVEVAASDEIGDLARAFDQVQTTAARLVERQAASRRNVAQMFGHVGRRTQNLVGRQIALIDQLESHETDARRLEELYRLDHLSSRLHRNAGSLVVLSGAARSDQHLTPLRLADAVRLGLAEIEDYTRVDVDVPSDVVLLPAAIGDVVLVLAELMENATSFSPPHTRVSVTAGTGPGGARLRIVDHGIGLSAERIAEENARLTRRERLDLVPTQVLGLFVVGRLARRHGLGITLSSTEGGGVTVTVDIPVRLLANQGSSAVALAAPVEAPPEAPAAQGRAAGPESAPAPHSDRSALDRVSQLLEQGRPWNAFVVPDRPALPGAVPAGALPGGPLASQGGPMGSGPVSPTPGAQDRARASASVPAAIVSATASAAAVHGAAQGAPPVRPAQGAAPVPPGTAAVPPGPPPTGGGSGRTPLRQRVPGAQLSVSASAPRLATPVDPDAARQLVEQFEAGVQRAQQAPEAPPQGQAPPPPVPTPMPAWPPAPTQPPAPPAPVPPQPPTPPMSVPSARPQAPGQSPLPPHTLARRVPGATLNDETRIRHRSPVADSPMLNPDDVRQFVEQFEAGVARAEHDSGVDHLHEGPSR